MLFAIRNGLKENPVRCGGSAYAVGCSAVPLGLKIRLFRRSLRASRLPLVRLGKRNLHAEKCERVRSQNDEQPSGYK